MSDIDDVQGTEDSAAIDWREDGPFDWDEVDLSDDPTERLDMGSLILTPLDGMELHMQVDEATKVVPAALGALGESALEVALFAAPRSEDMTDEVREDIIKATTEAGGTSEVVDGPFGPELRRSIPVTTPEGEEGFHISRTWLVSGPRWMLRGIVMGRAAMEPTPELTEPFVEFFKNTVVRRGEQPMPAGEIIVMQLPEGAIPVEQD